VANVGALSQINYMRSGKKLCYLLFVWDIDKHSKQQDPGEAGKGTLRPVHATMLKVWRIIINSVPQKLLSILSTSFLLMLHDNCTSDDSTMLLYMIMAIKHVIKYSQNGSS
jgi:hypothetical protein